MPPANRVDFRVRTHSPKGPSDTERLSSLTEEAQDDDNLGVSLVSWRQEAKDDTNVSKRPIEVIPQSGGHDSLERPAKRTQSEEVQGWDHMRPPSSSSERREFQDAVIRPIPRYQDDHPFAMSSTLGLSGSIRPIFRNPRLPESQHSSLNVFVESQTDGAIPLESLFEHSRPTAFRKTNKGAPLGLNYIRKGKPRTHNGPETSGANLDHPFVAPHPPHQSGSLNIFRTPPPSLNEELLPVALHSLNQPTFFDLIEKQDLRRDAIGIIKRFRRKRHRLAGLPWVAGYLNKDFLKYMDKLASSINKEKGYKPFEDSEKLMIQKAESLTIARRYAFIAAEFMFRANTFFLKYGTSQKEVEKILRLSFSWVKMVIDEIRKPNLIDKPADIVLEDDVENLLERVATEPLEGTDLVYVCNSLLKLWFFSGEYNVKNPAAAALSWRSMVEELSRWVMIPSDQDMIIPPFLKDEFQQRELRLPEMIVHEIFAPGKNKNGIDVIAEVEKVKANLEEFIKEFLLRISFLSMFAWQSGSEIPKEQALALVWLLNLFETAEFLHDDATHVANIEGALSNVVGIQRKLFRMLCGSEESTDNVIPSLLISWLNTRWGKNFGKADLFDSSDLLSLIYGESYPDVPRHSMGNLMVEPRVLFELPRLFHVMSIPVARRYKLSTPYVDEIREELLTHWPVELRDPPKQGENRMRKYPELFIKGLLVSPEGLHDLIYRTRRIMLNFLAQLEIPEDGKPAKKVRAIEVEQRAGLRWLTDLLLGEDIKLSKIRYTNRIYPDADDSDPYGVLRCWFRTPESKQAQEFFTTAVLSVTSIWRSIKLKN